MSSGVKGHGQWPLQAKGGLCAATLGKFSTDGDQQLATGLQMWHLRPWSLIQISWRAQRWQDAGTGWY